MKTKSRANQITFDLLDQYKHACESLERARELQSKATYLARLREYERDELLKQILYQIRKGGTLK